ncbi:cyclin-dependent protein kinase inhibitor SMR6-like [Aristolochia californica]|uniref:cyclin-dependent protein kinase inhibitor SMR6-like n=1 Tax=Aristolochia californica TaxID=171875 RepID=UPI0035D73956
MGISDKLQVEGGLESEGQKWVIAGVSLRSPLRPLNKKSVSEKESQSEVEEDEEGCSTTPTAEEARIPERLPCPSAPRKGRPSAKCRFTGARDFFVPPDLDSVFILRVERA